MRHPAQLDPLPTKSRRLLLLEDALHADHALLAVVERGGEPLQLLLLQFQNKSWGVCVVGV